MLCDFTAGVEVVSFLQVRLLPKVKYPYLPHLPFPSRLLGYCIPPLPSFPHSLPSSPPLPSRLPSPPLDSDIWVRTFEVMHSGSWHNRIVLDLTGLVSLYDIALVPSLIPVRAGLERWDHRVLGISSNDISQSATPGEQRH
ncbi:hypothetical protein BDR03DRAFT_1020009 [Suillus americanus]|nr:hypothetical protein BDR03DRAFT_1020009 [Suillus americanus]